MSAASVCFPTTPSGLSPLALWNDSTHGFSVTTSLSGSHYQNPGKGQNILNFSNAVITLTGGGLSQAVEGDVNFKPNGVVASNAIKHLVLKFIPLTGFFSGSLEDPDTKQKVTMQGAALQKQQVAAGYFTVGTSNAISGEILIHP